MALMVPSGILCQPVSITEMVCLHLSNLHSPSPAGHRSCCVQTLDSSLTISRLLRTIEMTIKHRLGIIWVRVSLGQLLAQWDSLISQSITSQILLFGFCNFIWFNLHFHCFNKNPSLTLSHLVEAYKSYAYLTRCLRTVRLYAR